MVLKTIQDNVMSDTQLVFIHLTPSWHNEMLRRLNRLRYFACDLNAICHVYDIGTTDFFVLPAELAFQWDAQLLKDRSSGFVNISKQEWSQLTFSRMLRGKYEFVIDKNLNGHYRSIKDRPTFRTVDFNLEQIVDPKIVEKHGYQ